MSCPHGDVHPACCADCLDGPPLVVRRTVKLDATKFTVANYEGSCKNRCGRVTDLGDMLGFVEGVGWCCGECAA